MDGRIQALGQLRAVEALAGVKVRVKPYDEIVSVDVTLDKISVLIRRVQVREYRYQTLFTGASLWLAVWTRTDTGWKQATDPIVIPDPDFKPYRRQELGEVQNRPADYEARLEWEALCAKPGDKSRLGGRDSFDRLDNTSPAGMKRMWAAHERLFFHSTSIDDE